MKYTLKQLIAIIVIFPSISAAAEIQVQPRGSVPGSVVLLGDVSRITGTDTSEIEQLKRLELFPAPTRGTARMVRRSEIRELLRLNWEDP